MLKLQPIKKRKLNNKSELIYQYDQKFELKNLINFVKNLDKNIRHIYEYNKLRTILSELKLLDSMIGMKKLKKAL